MRVVEPRNDEAAADINDASSRAGEPTDVCRRSHGDDSLASNSDGLCPQTRGVAREDLAADQDEIRRLLDRLDALRANAIARAVMSQPVSETIPARGNVESLGTEPTSTSDLQHTAPKAPTREKGAR